MASSVDDNYDDFHTVVTLRHECDLKETLLESTRKEISKLQSEVEKLQLEKDWCVNDQGERVVSTPRQQTLEICQQITLDPDLLKDFVKALRIKKIDLKCNITLLKENCDALRGKTN